MITKFRPLVYGGTALAAALALNVFVVADRAPATATGPLAAEAPVVAGPGRVEPVSEEVRVTAQIGGRLREVRVDEGDRVDAGQVIAIVSNDDFRARVASAEAMLQVKLAEARRVGNGARTQERAEAAASVKEAEATLEHARADHRRRRDLFVEQVISREEMDRADQQLKVAEARLEVARQRHGLVDAAAREEDQARADADVALARAQLEEARALYEKTFVRAPIGGIVLRRHLKPGEAVSTQFDSPIVTIADRSAVRVRVDVDETDISRVKVGDRAYVTADAWGDRRFEGRVTRVGQQLGKKNVRTDEPTERVDQKVLETLVELADGRELPIGLRVQAFIGNRP